VDRLIVLIILTLVAVGVAFVLQRRRPDPPSAPSYRAPTQLDRDDFADTAGRLLIVLFSSATCDSCPGAWAVIEAITARLVPVVAAERYDVQDAPELHGRYRIDGVPTTLVVDAEGVVVQAFFGPLTAEQLADALTEAGADQPGG